MIESTTLRVLVLGALLGAAGMVYGGERVERSLELEGFAPRGSRVAFRNLIGSMTVRAAEGSDRIRIEARVVAEGDNREAAETLAGAITLERGGRDGVTTFRVGYPVDRHTAFKLPRSEVDGLMAKWVSPLVRKSSVATRYDGRTVEVGNVKGAAQVAVHLDIEMPFELVPWFDQLVGSVHCVGYRGRVHVENIEGRVVAEQMYGRLSVRTSGAAVTVRTFRGERLAVHTGAGNIELIDVESQETRLDSGSGAIRGSSLTAETVHIDSVSGDVWMEGMEPAVLDVKSGSGAVDLSTLLTRTREASIRSVSGDVVLRVGKLPAFRFEAESEKGTIKTKGLTRLEVVEEGEHGAKMQRGRGGAKLRVITDSGGVTLRSI